MPRQYTPRVALTCERCGCTFTVKRCEAHYRFCSLACRWGPERSPEQRFWPNVERGETCWIWTGKCSRAGYGYLRLETRKPVYAHRLSWALNVGPIPDGLCVLHRCDNPPCVRPDHLFLGTQAENMADMASKKRSRGAGLRGSRNGLAKLTESDVVEIRRAVAGGTQQCVVAERLGVSRSIISNVVRRETWTHI